MRIPETEGLKAPHMDGTPWNFQEMEGCFWESRKMAYVYFVYPYYLKAEEPEIVTARTEYGTEIHASVERSDICLSVPSGKKQ